MHSVGARRRLRAAPPAAQLVLSAVLLAVLALAVLPASALAQRGHALAFSFGSGGLEAGDFEHPDGIAVENSTGELFVADRGNNRVEEFQPKLSGENIVEEHYVLSLAVPAPQSVAVDESSSDASKGDVYVVGDRSVITAEERKTEAKELLAEAKELKKEAAKLKKEAAKLKKEAKKLTGKAQQRAEEEAEKDLEAAETLKEEAVELRELAKEDKKKSHGKKAKEAEEEEAEEIAKEAANPELFWVYKFSPTGTLLTTLRGYRGPGASAEPQAGFASEDGAPEVAVNSAGSLLVYHNSPEIFEFNAETKNKPEAVLKASVKTELRRPFAVDAQGNFYVGVEEDLEEHQQPIVESIAEEDEAAGIVPKGQFAVLAKLNGASGAETNPALDLEYTTAVAVSKETVSKENVAYLTNVTPGALAGEALTTVAAFSSAGTLLERFGAPGLRFGDAIAVDPSTETVYVADAASDRVDVFGLEPPGQPHVSELSACISGGGAECPSAPGAVTLKAQVNPTGAATSYQFEYGPGSCSEVPSPCTLTPAKPAGGGFGYVPASQEVSEFTPGVWHYRVVATNEFGTVRSGEQTLSVVSSNPGAALPDARQWQMVTPQHKEGTEPEAMNSSGGEIEASENGDAITYVADGPAGSEPEGNRSPEPTQLLSTRSSSGWSTQNLTTANSRDRGIVPTTYLPGAEYQGFSPNLALSLVEPFPGEEHAALSEPPLSPPLSEGERGKQEKTIYLRDDGPEEILHPGPAEAEDYRAAAQNGQEMGNAGFLALIDEGNAPGGEPFGAGTGVGKRNGLQDTLAATPDLTHVLLYSNRAAPGIYEWGPPGSCSEKAPAAKPPVCTGGDDQLVSILPDGQRALAPVVGGNPQGIIVRHAISSDGALVFWTAQVDEHVHVYVRDTVTQETLQLDSVRPGASGEGASYAYPEFATANASGTRVYFTDVQRLTANSHSSLAAASEHRPDLYVAELSGGRVPGSHLAETLTDLTPGAPGDSAEIVSRGREPGGGVLGASECPEQAQNPTAACSTGGAGASEEDGYVYFVANGVLAPGAKPGACNVTEPVTPRATCNLYVRHYSGGEWQPTKLVAVLSQEDLPDFGGSGLQQEGALPFVTSRVSPDGRYLAFMSDRSLTGYDNEDVTSKKAGERLDEEVYLYDASSEQLACASCAPDGARPAGIEDNPERESEEGAGLLVDRPETWGLDEAADHWLAGNIPGWTPLSLDPSNYQSRYLSNTGRLFFNSPVDLVPAATSPAEKVYEYEPDGLGSCAGAAAGCVGLISSGDSEREAAFLDASANGNDVFFITADRLVEGDVEAGYNVYDAHVCEASSPCLKPPAASPPPCETKESCSDVTVTVPIYQAPASASVRAPGNVKPAHNVLPVTVTVAPKPKPKPLTRAQELAKALKACKKDRKKSTRAACEKRARKLYGPVKKAKKSSAKGRRG